MIRARLPRRSSSPRNNRDVLGLPHEREPDVVDLVRRGPVEIDQVFVGERRHTQARPRHIDPLVRADVARQRDLEPRPTRTASHHIHRDRAVGEKHALPHIQVVGQGAVGRGQAMRVVFLHSLVHQDELRVVVAVDDAAHDLTQPDLGAAQILQDGELSLGLRGDPPDRLERGGMHLHACRARS